MKGLISNIQKFSLHDGKGIRTTVFFQGCPMHCVWCHNPEALNFSPSLRFHPAKCIGCGMCFQECKTGALRMERFERKFEQALCTSCFCCVKVCPSAALEICGREMEVQQVVQKVLADKVYYQKSGGGVTLSGGEPTAQPDFALELLRLLKEHGIHTAIETSLCLGYSAMEAMLPFLDEIYCDIKILDEEKHRTYTGMSNYKILDGIIKLASCGKPVTIRTPLIPGITDSEENIGHIAAWLQKNAPSVTYELLNYNPLGEAKWQECGAAYPIGKKEMLSKERVAALVDFAKKQGLLHVKGRV